MRCEILSRGKRLDNGDWIEGFYVHLYDDKRNEVHRIYTGYAETDCGDFYPDWFDVDPATVGRYTGLTDRNAVKIFEGDIVSTQFFRFAVTFREGCFGGFIGDGSRKYFSAMMSSIYGAGGEVIGNVHDNPELLEEAQ